MKTAQQSGKEANQISQLYRTNYQGGLFSFPIFQLHNDKIQNQNFVLKSQYLTAQLQVQEDQNPYQPNYRKHDNKVLILNISNTN